MRPVLLIMARTPAISLTCREIRIFAVVRDADQAAVEHPVHGPGEGESIADDIRSIGLDRPDMRGFDLRAPEAIDQFQGRDRAARVVGPQHDAAEHAVPDDAGSQIGDAVGFLARIWKTAWVILQARGKRKVHRRAAARRCPRGNPSAVIRSKSAAEIGRTADCARPEILPASFNQAPARSVCQRPGTEPD